MPQHLTPTAITAGDEDINRLSAYQIINKPCKINYAFWVCHTAKALPFHF